MKNISIREVNHYLTVRVVFALLIGKGMLSAKWNGGRMRAVDVVKLVSKRTNTPLMRISERMGKTPSYVSAAVSKGVDMHVSTFAEMLDACGYGLYAMPKDDAPEDAVQVTNRIEWAYINGECE